MVRNPSPSVRCLLVLAAAGGLLGGCASAMSERELASQWSPTFLADASQAAGALVGKPSEAPKPTLYCYRYTLTFNEEKVLTRWKREECVPGTRAQLRAQ